MTAMNSIPERIHGDGFYLRKWKVNDAEWYIHARDEEIFQWTTEKHDLTVAETEAAILRVNARTDAVSFAIVDSSTDSLLGNMALVIFPDDTGAAEMMYWLAAAARGRGIATQAVLLFRDWAFQSLGLTRILLKIRPGNRRSQRVAERAGFRQIEYGDTDDLWFEKMNPTGSETGLM